MKIGLIGCGRIMPAHLRGYKVLMDRGLAEFRITALCARKEGDALRFRKRGEGPPPRPPVTTSTSDPLAAPHIYVSDIHDDVLPEIYTDYREMLEKADIDAVDIYTPLFNHHEIVISALEAGKDVMVEKPMAITVRACKEIIKKAKKAGKVVAVAECARFSPGTRAMRFAVEKGYLGELQIAWCGGIATDDWSPDRVVANTPWRHIKRLGGGGCSVDLGVHLFNILRYVGGNIRRVSAVAKVLEKERLNQERKDRIRCEVDDAFFAWFEYERGAIGELSFSWACFNQPVCVPGFIALYGNKGCIKEGKIYTKRFTEPLTDFYKKRAPGRELRSFFPGAVEDSFALEKLDWILAIEEGRRPEVSAEEGLVDVALSYAILESSVLGRAVTLREVLSARADAYQRAIDRHYGFI